MVDTKNPSVERAADKELTLQVTVPVREIRRIILSAIGSNGIAYWCSRVEVLDEDAVDVLDAILNSNGVRLTTINPDTKSDENPVFYYLTLSKMYEGLSKFILGRGGVTVDTGIWESKNVDFDGRVASVIFQLAVFGRVEFS